MDRGREELRHALNAALYFYFLKVKESLNFGEKMFGEKLKLAGEEISENNDLLSRNMRRALDVYQKHVALMRQGQRGQLSRGKILLDIVPENLREGLDL
jgi:hypothetical protein